MFSRLLRVGVGGSRLKIDISISFLILPFNLRRKYFIFFQNNKTVLKLITCLLHSHSRQSLPSCISLYDWVGPSWCPSWPGTCRTDGWTCGGNVCSLCDIGGKLWTDVWTGHTEYKCNAQPHGVQCIDPGLHRREVDLANRETFQRRLMFISNKLSLS